MASLGAAAGVATYGPKVSQLAGLATATPGTRKGSQRLPGELRTRVLQSDRTRPRDDLPHRRAQPTGGGEASD